MSTGVNVNDPLRAKRALLASRLREEEARVQLLPLSFAQERLWFLDQLEPNSSLYHVATLARLTGHLNLSALEHAVNSVVRRHEALRVRFLSVEGVPHQVIDPPGATEVRLIDISSLKPSAAQAEAAGIIQE
ncbi:MAG: condensation domain-containing protein, partial [Limisphaerales bacterium]